MRFRNAHVKEPGGVLVLESGQPGSVAHSGGYGNNNGGYQRPQYQQSRPQQTPAPMPAEEEDDIPF